MKSKLKLFSVLTLFLIGLIAISGVANADSDVPVTIEKMKLNGDEIDMWDWNCDDDECWMGEVRGDILRGDELEVKLKLKAGENDKYIEVESSLKGLDHDKDKARAYSDTFSVKEGQTYWETLTLELPQRMDAEEYVLRIEVSNREGWEVVYNLRLDVNVPRNAILIKDVLFSPEGSVKAGRSLLTTVRLKNIGEADEEDVKVKVDIPELGISASDYLDEVEEEDTVTSEELYMRIPEYAEAGEYKVLITAEFDEGDKIVSEEYTITVLGEEGALATNGKTIITVGSEMQDITAGGDGAFYPLTLSNTGSAAKTYTITAIAGDWAEIKISPNVVVLGAGETKIAYVSVAAKEGATAGEQTFGIAIKSGDKTLKEITLKANVLEPESAGWGKVKKGLEVALVILVVLLVIIGLIIGFNRLKGSDEEEEPKEETYY